MARRQYCKLTCWSCKSVFMGSILSAIIFYEINTVPLYEVGFSNLNLIVWCWSDWYGWYKFTIWSITQICNSRKIAKSVAKSWPRIFTILFLIQLYCFCYFQQMIFQIYLVVFEKNCMTIGTVHCYGHAVLFNTLGTNLYVKLKANIDYIDIS